MNNKVWMNSDPCRFRKISKLKPRPKKKLAQPCVIFSLGGSHCDGIVQHTSTYIPPISFCCYKQLLIIVHVYPITKILHFGLSIIIETVADLQQSLVRQWQTSTKPPFFLVLPAKVTDFYKSFTTQVCC